MDNIGQLIDKFIKERINSINSNDHKLYEYINTDNFGEMVEKLIILHQRVWILEDKISENPNNSELIADLKRKIDICFKQKRPKLVEGINKIIDDSIVNNKSLIENNVKLYKGHE